MKSKRHLVSSQAQSSRKANEASENHRLPEPTSKKTGESSDVRHSPKALVDDSKLDYAQLRKMLEEGLESGDPEAM